MQTSAPPLRSDGERARRRLLSAALVLFARHGYAKTSIRAISEAAHTNVASISYYFGDKQGLYRAIFEDPELNLSFDQDELDITELDLRSVVDQLLRDMVEPLKKSSEQVLLCMKLHFREMVEPTGMWQAEIENNIKPAHALLVAALCKHFGLEEADDDIHRLAFEISGMGIMLHVGLEVIQVIRPQLLETAKALDCYHERLLSYAMALVALEENRRNTFQC
jgi:AcrR family transcriptional regulator